ncbi:Eaa1 [Klebsiella pneumoniae]|nr:Eaa1 [Klebsiella pneumoniae]
MTKSTITREQLEEWVAQFDEDGGCDATDMQLEALIRQSLAAMDSESGCLPLDYLQGHKDGLEWAAQLAEANHPETGDWLYDDPIELAKAIRKGPDMPPVQPVEDSDPDRNPVLAYADSYRDMAKQGVESVPIWSVITDIERNIAPLYRHAQQPVVSADLLHTAASAIEDLLTTKDRTGAGVWFDLPFRLRSAANAQPVPVVPELRVDWQENEFRAGWNACRAAMLQAGTLTNEGTSLQDNHSVDDTEKVNSPLIPNGYVMVPKEMTDEIGEAIAMQANCCGGIALDIYDAMLAAAPHDTPALNSPQSVDSVTGGWIPVSERMPEAEGHYLVWANASRIDGYCNHLAMATYQGGEWSNEFNWLVTHWMPLPAGPKEVQGE